ncbi:hypothetical protein E2C01_072016 [Portunus trituberculatus]|uniref:Secreted protein n=1 Tax=Portunus trituberculatus TaxID=210409 RepID=A0A5B7I6N0_PORTR|nr:hypothetical protein [Portunus trituberculatus]
MFDLFFFFSLSLSSVFRCVDFSISLLSLPLTLYDHVPSHSSSFLYFLRLVPSHRLRLTFPTPRLPLLPVWLREQHSSGLVWERLDKLFSLVSSCCPCATNDWDLLPTLASSRASASTEDLNMLLQRNACSARAGNVFCFFRKCVAITVNQVQGRRSCCVARVSGSIEQRGAKAEERGNGKQENRLTGRPSPPNIPKTHECYHIDVLNAFTALVSL